MDLLDKIGEVAEASSEGTCSNAQFVANTLHELSDALSLECKPGVGGRALLRPSCWLLLQEASCRAFLCLVLTPLMQMGEVLLLHSSGSAFALALRSRVCLIPSLLSSLFLIISVAKGS
jgi:hypothetical protein